MALLLTTSCCNNRNYDYLLSGKGANIFLWNRKNGVHELRRDREELMGPLLMVMRSTTHPGGWCAVHHSPGGGCSVQHMHRILGYLYTCSGFETAKTAPWPSRGLHHFGKFLEPSDEWAGRECCCFLMRWHSWAFLAHQEWAPEICRAQILIFQF